LPQNEAHIGLNGKNLQVKVFLHVWGWGVEVWLGGFGGFFAAWQGYPCVFGADYVMAAVS
jgi:hypothetical protein